MQLVTDNETLCHPSMDSQIEKSLSSEDVQESRGSVLKCAGAKHG